MHVSVSPGNGRTYVCFPVMVVTVYVTKVLGNWVAENM